MIALVCGQHPDWSYDRVINQVLSAFDPLASLQGKTASGGPLNAARALAAEALGAYATAATPSWTVVGPVGSVRATSGEAMDPASFTAADVAGFTGPDAVTSVAAVAGSNGRQSDHSGGIYFEYAGPRPESGRESLAEHIIPSMTTARRRISPTGSVSV